MNISDEILKKCGRGNNTAYKELYGLTIKYVFAIVSSYLSNTETVKDVIQETYAGVFISIRKFDREKGDFKTWLRRICINKCVEHYRRQNKFSEISSFDALLYPHPKKMPEYDILTREDIISLLDQMPDGYRTVFLLIEIDGYSHKEVGEMIGVSINNSRTQLHRAKNWIKKNITEQDLNRYGFQRI